MNLFLPLLPEIFIFLVSVVLLITGLFIKSSKIINNSAIVSILIAIFLVLVQPVQSILDNSFIIDEFSRIWRPPTS